MSLARADATAVPLRDGSVDLIVTSPPYFALRSYTDGGEHYDGQIGSESTPGDFLTALWTVLDECWRVLKPGGSCWVNLGDKYSGAQAQSGSAGFRTDTDKVWAQTDPKRTGILAKSLMGLPWRFALGLTCPDPYRTCYQAGDHPQWVLRAEVVWSKRRRRGRRVPWRDPQVAHPRLVVASSGPLRRSCRLSPCGRVARVVGERGGRRCLGVLSCQRKKATGSALTCCAWFA